MFEELDDYFDELSEALRSVRGKLGTVKVENIFDRTDVARAIAEMESIIDGRLSPYMDNPAVAELAGKMKAAYRQKILEAVEAQKAQASSHKPQGQPLPTNPNPAWRDLLGPSCRSINPIAPPATTGRPLAGAFEWPNPARFRNRRP